MPQLRIGISGWRYGPWRGTVYPKGLPQKRELEYAWRRLNSIEVNGSFYALQRPACYRQWYEETPDDFVFSLKDRPLRHAVAIRHPSFLVPAFMKRLRKHNVAFVCADTAGLWPYAEDVTADFVYVRLHGDEQIYVSGYTDAALDGIARPREIAGGQGATASEGRRPPAGAIAEQSRTRWPGFRRRGPQQVRA